MWAGSIVNCQLDMQHSVMAPQTGRVSDNTAHRRARTVTLLFRWPHCRSVLLEE
jgi:hypothetical protein